MWNPIEEFARRRANNSAFSRLVTEGEPTHVRTLSAVIFPLDNVSYYVNNRPDRGLRPRGQINRPLEHTEVNGSVTLFQSGKKYRAVVAIDEILEPRVPPLPVNPIISPEALAPNEQDVKFIKHGPDYSFTTVYTTDPDGNNWSLHIPNPPFSNEV